MNNIELLKVYINTQMKKNSGAENKAYQDVLQFIEVMENIDSISGFIYSLVDQIYQLTDLLIEMASEYNVTVEELIENLSTGE